MSRVCYLQCLALALCSITRGTALNITGSVARIGIDDFDNDAHYGYLEITSRSGESYNVVVDEDTEQLLTGDTVQLQLEPWTAGQTNAMTVPNSSEVQSWWKGTGVIVQVSSVAREARDGDRNVLFILVCLQTTCPSYTNHDKLLERMLDVNNLTRESSYQRTGFPADQITSFKSVVDHDIKSYTTCDWQRARRAANSVLVEKRKTDPSLPNPNSYRHVAFMIPTEIPGCSWGGLGYVGGQVTVNRGDHVGLLAHELGHNIGMWHAAADWNDDGKQDSEYGDQTSFMGNAYALSSVHALQRKKMGWIPSSEVIDLDACTASEVVLRDLALLNNSGPSSSKLIATIDRAASLGGGVYYLSYRSSSMRRRLHYLEKRVSVHYHKFRNTQAVSFMDNTSVCGRSCQSSPEWTGRTSNDYSFTLKVQKMDESSATVQVLSSCVATTSTTTTTTMSSQSSTFTASTTRSSTTATTAPVDLKLLAYWDQGNCGPMGDDYQWEWCGKHGFKCKNKVSTTHCATGYATLKSVQGGGWGNFVVIKGCRYAYYATYECSVSSTTSSASTTTSAHATTTPSSTTSTTSLPSTTTSAQITTTTTTTSSTTSTTSLASTRTTPRITTTQIPTTATATLTSTTSSSHGSTTQAPRGVVSGDIVFLKTFAGRGNHIDVEGTAVRARWQSHGEWQALTIQKSTPGEVHSGDTVYLQSHTGAHIDVVEETVQARWQDTGAWQAMTIEKRSKSGSSVILPDDIICLRAHTNRHLDVQDGAVRARWTDCGDWQAMRIEKEASGALFSGDSITLLAHTTKRIEVEGSLVGARWSEAGVWQTFTIKNYGGRAISYGNAVFLKAHTGKLLHVQETSVLAKWEEYGAWQTFVIENKDELSSGPVLPGDSVFLHAHTGRFVEVHDDAVNASWFEKGAWQALTIERAGQRRLMQTQADLASKHKQITDMVLV